MFMHPNQEAILSLVFLLEEQMKYRKDQPVSSEVLRRQAEDILQENPSLSSENPHPLSPEEIRKTIHELRVHQIELEMQNEELRRAHAELNAARARYFDLYDLAPVGYCTLSSKGYILEANLTVTTLLGTARNELISQPVTRYILRRDDQDIFYLSSKRLFRTGEPQTRELQMVKKDGTPFWALLSMTGTPENTSNFIFRITINDISDRKRLEAEQKQAERKINELNLDFISFLENTTDLVYFKDKNLRYRFCSQALANLTGHANWRDIVGKHTLDIFPDQIAQIYHEEDISIFHDGKSILNKDDPCQTSSGKAGRLITSKWPLKDIDGDVVGLFGISRDITELKMLEDELKQINLTLEQRVAREVQKNMEQERMLIHQSRMAAMGEMLDNIAHQWKQPLNALNLLLFNIKDAYQYNEMNEEFIDQVLADGTRLVLNMSTTITDFRNFFQPDKEVKAFSVMDQIRQAIVLIQSDFDKNQIFIRIDAPDDLILYGFPNELSHVLLNLLSNSKDVILKHRPQVYSLDIVVTAQGDQGCIMVRDTGGGIPKEILDRIFDPYFTTKKEGTGIGLYMSKVIIELHMKGSLTAKNIAGGVEFCIRVPLANLMAS